MRDNFWNLLFLFPRMKNESGNVHFRFVSGMQWNWNWRSGQWVAWGQWPTTARAVRSETVHSGHGRNHNWSDPVHTQAVHQLVPKATSLSLIWPLADLISASSWKHPYLTLSSLKYCDYLFWSYSIFCFLFHFARQSMLTNSKKYVFDAEISI